MWCLMGIDLKFHFEPWLTDQWYCNAKILAQEPIKAVQDGRTKFVPKNWENTFLSG